MCSYFQLVHLVDYKEAFFQSFLDLIGKSKGTTITPEIPHSTIKLPESIGDREKEAYNFVKGILYIMYIKQLK